MFNFLHRTLQARPRPFVKLQKYFGIQEEWSTFKSYVRPHKFKMVMLTTFAAYPLYKPYLEYYSTTSNLELQAQLKTGQPAPQAIESFAKHLVQKVLRDPQMKSEGVIFLSDVAKKDVALETIVTLLTECAKDPRFISDILVITKYLTYELLHDKALKEEAIALIAKLMNDHEIRAEVHQVAKWLLKQQEIKKEIIELGREGFHDPKMQFAVKELCRNAGYEILKEKETIEKLQLFSFFLLTSGNSKGAKEVPHVRGLINILIDRAAKGWTVESNDIEFRKALKRELSEDMLENRDESVKNNQIEEKEQKRYFFF